MRNGLLVSLFLTLSLATSSAQAESVWVQVKTSQVRSSPEHYAPGIASVNYGQSLTKVSEEAGWVKVKLASGGQGYIPLASVSPYQIVLSGGGASKNKAAGTDVVLAGKGFSPQVEGQYKKGGDVGRFDLVDRIEKAPQVTTAELNQFIKSGGLKG